MRQVYGSTQERIGGSPDTDSTVVAMTPTPPLNPTRRAVLATAAATAVMSTASAGRSAATDAFGAIEAEYDRVIGVWARNLRTGQTLVHRSDDRFAMCSTFKVPLAAAVLAGHVVADHPRLLERSMPYPPSMVPDDLWAPTTKKWLAEGYIPDLGQQCQAAIADSDNGAANVLIQQVGGPAEVTRFLRSIGDPTSRLDRWEPEMSVYDAPTHRDTTTPYAMGRTYVRLLLGRALCQRDRERLLAWTRKTSLRPPFHEALPPGWSLADKTGSGDFASRNDVGIAWTPDGTPLVVSCFTRSDRIEDPRLDEPLTKVFAACIERLV